MSESFIVYLMITFTVCFVIFVVHAIVRDWWKERKMNKYLLKLYMEE